MQDEAETRHLCAREPLDAPEREGLQVLQEKGEIQLEGDEPLLGKGSVQSMLQQFLWDKGKPSKA